MADWAFVAEQSGLTGRDPRFDQPPASSQRERRAHARAYRYWQTLCAGRRLPTLAEVDPRALDSFAANSVLFAVPPDAQAATIRFIGAALATEAGGEVDRPDQVTSAPGTLLGELASRLPLIAKTTAPLDFEAEFIGQADTPTLYRGILLPFAGDDGRIGFVYGVITWKMIEAVVAPDICAAVGSAMALESDTAMTGTPWDAPLPAEPLQSLPQRSFAQRIAAAQTWAALAGTDHAHRDVSLHAALSAAYDFLVAEGELSGGVPDEAETAAVVGLVFGPTLDGTLRSRFRAVLEHAKRLNLGAGTLAAMLDRHVDGLDGFLAATPAEAPVWDTRYLRIAAIDGEGLLDDGGRQAAPVRDQSSAVG